MSAPGFFADGMEAPLAKGLLPIQRVEPKAYTWESADKSNQRKVTVGEGHLLVDVHPDDLRAPLRNWLAGGDSMHVEYRPDVTKSDGAVKVSIYVDDVDTVFDRSWHQRMTRIRVVPRAESTMRELLVAMGLGGMAEELDG